MTAVAAKSEAADQGRSQPRPWKLLVEAGFSAVPSAALALCRLRILDFARSRKSILPRRAISLLSLAGKHGQTTAVELTVSTVLGQSERRAADINVRYFSLFGREVGSIGGCRFSLFADPLTGSAAQRFYVDPPLGACWTLVTIQRQADARRIGITGSLRPKAVSGEQPLALDAALASRDRRALAHHLAQARGSNDRATAMKLLSRMIFLERRADDSRAMRFIADIEQTMADLIGRVTPPAAKQGGYHYDRLFTVSFDNSVPLSKWLASEAISLSAAISGKGQGGVVLIPAGPNKGLRAMTAVSAGYSVVPDGTQNDMGGECEQIPWIKGEELLSFLTPS